jgi:hypothetical protein
MFLSDISRSEFQGKLHTFRGIPCMTIKFSSFFFLFTGPVKQSQIGMSCTSAEPMHLGQQRFILKSCRLELCTSLPAQTKYEFHLCNALKDSRLGQLIVAGFEALTAVVMKSPIFWDIMLCSPLKVNRRFSGKPPDSTLISYSPYSTLKTKAICFSEMSVDF